MTAKALAKLHVLIAAVRERATLGFEDGYEVDALAKFVDEYGQAQRREGRRDALGRTPRKAKPPRPA